MWSRMVYQNITSYYLPMIRSWPRLGKYRYLPVCPVRENLAVITNKITKDMCDELYFLHRYGVESACMLCRNAVMCSINKRGKETTFEADMKCKTLTWIPDAIRLFKDTVEVPFLVLYPDLAKKLAGKPFEIEFIGEIYDMAFDKFRILRNIDVLLTEDVKKLKRYQTIIDFAYEEQNMAVPNFANLKCKLTELRDKISGFSEKDFNDAIATMEL